MDMSQLNLTPGTWLVADCGKMPSERGCKLVMMAPEDQKADLVEAGVAHMVKDHGHTEEDARKFAVESEDEYLAKITV